jgi:hypothetical protein
MDLPAIASLLRTAILTASGLEAGQVVFANQKARAPESDYLTIKLTGVLTLGGPKGEAHDFDAARSVGQEIELRAQGPAELGVSLQAFTLDPDAAEALLVEVQGKLQLSVTSDALNAGGVSLFDFGRVQNVPRVYGGDVEGRATLDLRGLAVQTSTSRLGYIAEVQGQGEGALAAAAFDVVLPE